MASSLERGVLLFSRTPASFPEPSLSILLWEQFNYLYFSRVTASQITANSPKETFRISENDWGRYISGDDPEDCSIRINKDIEKGQGTAKINPGLPVAICCCLGLCQLPALSGAVEIGKITTITALIPTIIIIIIITIIIYLNGIDIREGSTNIIVLNATGKTKQKTNKQAKKKLTDFSAFSSSDKLSSWFFFGAFMIWKQHKIITTSHWFH